jgi:hypothetical protein
MDDDVHVPVDDPTETPPPEDLIFDTLPSWNDKVWVDDDQAPPDVILGELMLMYFEWMGTFKPPDASAKAVYGVMNLLMPKDANGGSWYQAQKLLTAIYDNTVVAVDICPNDCIAYYDCKHPKMKHYQHAHRTWCPCCGANRRVTHADGSSRVARQGYYLPCGTWFRDLFKVEGMPERLSTDNRDNIPSGHASKSRGWKQKVCFFCLYVQQNNNNVYTNVYILHKCTRWLRVCIHLCTYYAPTKNMYTYMYAFYISVHDGYIYVYIYVYILH